MLSSLKSLIVRKVTIKWELGNVRCKKHQHKKQYCDFVVESNSKMDIIHSLHENYTVNNHRVHCEKIPSITYDLLSCSHNLILDSSSKAYIHINGEKIFKVKSRYITMKLLVYCNSNTINGQLKMIGM